MKTKLHGSRTDTLRRFWPLLLSVASLLAVTLLAWVALSGAATASITPDSQPKDWPANLVKHQVVIRREAADKQQSNMIAAAEAAQPSKETLRQAAEARDRNDPLGLAQPKEAQAPVGDKETKHSRL